MKDWENGLVSLSKVLGRGNKNCLFYSGRNCRSCYSDKWEVECWWQLKNYLFLSKNKNLRIFPCIFSKSTSYMRDVGVLWEQYFEIVLNPSKSRTWGAAFAQDKSWCPPCWKGNLGVSEECALFGWASSQPVPAPVASVHMQEGKCPRVWKWK